jgi:putative ABC transport system permease protein
MSWHDRMFKTLMRLLPAEFRGDYEREMAATFRAERRSADGPVSLTRVWFAIVADVFRTAPAEHLDILRRDVAYACRMLARRPVLTLTSLLMLALGIGANTAIFSVVNGVLFAPFDYRHADDLVLIEEQPAGRDPGMTGYLTFADLRDQNVTLESTAAVAGWSATLTGDGKDAELVAGVRVTWQYFRTVGLTPAIGRDFERAEDRPGRNGVVIISDSLWRRRYGADPNIVGRQITVNQQTVTLAGVLPPDTSDIIAMRPNPGAGAEIWTLLGYAEHLVVASRGSRHIFVVARLKDGVTATEAGADLTRIFQSLATRFPNAYDRPRPVTTPLRDYFLGPVKTPLYLLWGAVGLLLLIACANIANLLLIRASEREEEIAVRLALGVSPARMLRQLLTEAVVLAAIGGAAGAAVAFWTTALLTTNGPAGIPRLSEVSPDARVLGYAIALSLATGVMFGLAPARMLRPGVSAGGSRRATSGPGAWRYRAALIAGNVALCVLLLLGSGLLVRSFARLLAVDAGFTPQQLLTFHVNLTGDRYRQSAGITQFLDELTARLVAMPGVTNVSGSSMLPLTDSIAQMTVRIEGRSLVNPAAAPVADTYAVRPDYFSTMGIPVLGGRGFESADGERTAPVAIISKATADELWPGEDPIGRRIAVPGGPQSPLRTIVGIVGNVRHYGLHMPVTMQVYLPHAQQPWPMAATMVVRTAGGIDPLSLASSVREHVRSIDPLQPVTQIQTFDDIVAQSMATRRFTLVLLAVFAGTAVLLAIGGLYGALSYIVSQRHRDIGVRVALGASARAITGLVMRQGMTPAIVGLGAGLLASVAIGRVIESMLFGVSPRDLMTYAIVVTLIVAGALVACLVPARRAASIDAAVTLRAE